MSNNTPTAARHTVGCRSALSRRQGCNVKPCPDPAACVRVEPCSSEVPCGANSWHCRQSERGKAADVLSCDLWWLMWKQWTGACKDIWLLLRQLASQAAVGAGEDAARPEAPRVAAAGPVYKFPSRTVNVQFSTPPFLSQDRAELQALFERFKSSWHSYGCRCARLECLPPSVPPWLKLSRFKHLWSLLKG